MWNDDYNKRYFDLMLKYKDRLVIELAGHDHWEDFRLYVDKDGNKFRNMFIASGIGMDHRQLPGFNTMKIDEQSLLPKDFRETILDVTKAYGHEQPPPLDSLPIHTVDFAQDYGMKDVSADSLYAKIQSFEKDDFNNVLNYLSDKLGFDHKDPASYAQGLDLAASWSLINKKHTKADAFFC